MSSRSNAARRRLAEKLAKQRPTTKTICLVMIVKNESAIIERCLNSLLTVIDCLSIVDTGSTDDTITIIRRWCSEHSIPGTVHQELFRDFGWSRTDSLNKARSTYPNANYYLLSDADMVWNNHQFNKSLLIEDGYHVMSSHGDILYCNLRLLSNRHTWKCLGVTHEFWSSSDSTNTRLMKTLSITDLDDGGCKADKFERDIRMISTALSSGCTQELRRRYKFYLAQSYYALGQYSTAIEWYEKRVRSGGYIEEIYYSYYRIGLCNEGLAEAATGDEVNKYSSLADEAYRNAWRTLFTRAEALYRAVRMHRIRGDRETAYELAKKGRTIVQPKEGLFLEPAVYDYLFDYELSIVSYYIPGSMNEGRDACAKLLERTDLPEWLMKDVRFNSRYYV